MDTREKMKLHYELMGIGLSVMAHKKKSFLFNLLDQALLNTDWKEMKRIHDAFETLPDREKKLILEGGGDAPEIGVAISNLEVKIYLNGARKEPAPPQQGHA